jgi:single-strand DNA-binding protein
MNKVMLMGRLVRDPEVRYLQSDNPTTVARWNLAVDRRYKKSGEQDADFISCVAFGRAAEHAEKYYKQGLKIAITGRLQSGSYTNKDGIKVYTTDVVIEESEFAEAKNTSQGNREAPSAVGCDGFMHIPDGIDEEMPFS